MGQYPRSGLKTMYRLSQSRHQLKDRIRNVFDRASPTYDQVGPRFFSYFGRNVVALAKPNKKPTRFPLNPSRERQGIFC
jgi:hypothetical protein